MFSFLFFEILKGLFARNFDIREQDMMLPQTRVENTSKMFQHFLNLV